MKVFKPAILALFGATILFSCEKIECKDKNENEREIEISALPQVVKTAVDRDYPGATLVEADEITQDDKSLTYDIEINNGGQEIEVMYDANGTFLGIEADDED